MQSDPLTIAYIAAGVRNILSHERANSPAYEAISNGLGETGVMACAIQHADMIDDLYTEHAENFDGVHAYEVSEPFGQWFIERWLETGTEPTDAECKAEALHLTLGCVGAHGIPMADPLASLITAASNAALAGLPDVARALREVHARTAALLTATTAAQHRINKGGTTPEWAAVRAQLDAALAKFATGA